MTVDDVGRELQRGLRRLFRATLLLWVVVVVAIVWVWLNSSETTDAVCALRQEVEHRVATSEKFLKDNPEGLLPAFPAVSIRKSIREQRRTIDALSGPCQ